MGDTAMAKRRSRRIEKSVEAMRKHMWDEQSGTFLAVKRDTLEKVRVATIGSWMPLLADVPTEAMVKRMAEDDHDARTGRHRCRCPRWTARTSAGTQTATGAAMSGPRPITRWRRLLRATATPTSPPTIADKTVANALKNGISEHYNSVTGKPLGVPYIGMCCTIVTMMLDRLCRQFQLRVRRA